MKAAALNESAMLHNKSKVHVAKGKHTAESPPRAGRTLAALAGYLRDRHA